MFDMILNFFTPITSDCGKVEITDKKKIAANYLKTWFLIDMLSIIPYEVFLNGNKRYNILARSSRLFKISKLIRLARLIKGLKKLNGAKALDANFSAMMQINSGQDRLTMSTIFFALSSHIFACIWLLLGQVQESLDTKRWYQPEISLMPWSEQYLLSIYFVVTTMTTVGYGDNYACTSLERAFCIILMVIGVIIFTYISGTLSSIL